jgi:hypothetical protein
MTRYLLSDEQSRRDDVDAQLAKLHAKKVDGRPSLVITGAKGSAGNVCQSATHGGFDADVATMNSVLHRILGAAPAQPFSERDLSFKSKASSFGPQHPAPLQQVELPAARRAPANNQLRHRRLGA